MRGVVAMVIAMVLAQALGSNLFMAVTDAGDDIAVTFEVYPYTN